MTNAGVVLGLVDGWIADYNTVHPHSALRMRSPAEFRAAARFDLVKGVEEGWLRVVVAETFSLDRAADAHRAMVGEHGAGKIVLRT